MEKYYNIKGTQSMIRPRYGDYTEFLLRPVYEVGEERPDTNWMEMDGLLDMSATGTMRTTLA